MEKENIPIGVNDDRQFLYREQSMYPEICVDNLRESAQRVLDLLMCKS